MSKYSFEFKKKVVQAYLNGEGGRPYIANKYGIPASSNVMQWVNNYKQFGDDGLKCSHQNKKFSFERKLAVVELYLSSELSYQELALQEGILHPSQIARWVKDFLAIGPDALRPRKKGRRKTLDTPQKDNRTEITEKSYVNISAEHVKALEDELLKLRIENAFLKELRRLRLEDESKMRDMRESSTASEDHSSEKIFSHILVCQKQLICIGKKGFIEQILIRS